MVSVDQETDWQSVVYQKLDCPKEYVAVLIPGFFKRYKWPATFYSEEINERLDQEDYWEDDNE